MYFTYFLDEPNDKNNFRPKLELPKIIQSKNKSIIIINLAALPTNPPQVIPPVRSYSF